MLCILSMGLGSLIIKWLFIIIIKPTPRNYGFTELAYIDPTKKSDGCIKYIMLIHYLFDDGGFNIKSTIIRFLIM